MSPHLGIERLAGYLRLNGHHVETYDTNLCKALGHGIELTDKLNEKSWDIIGFSIYEETMVEDIGNIGMAAKLCPHSLVIAGGPGAQYDYQTVLDKSRARLVILGEGEKPLLALAEGKALEEIPGIIFRNDNLPLTTDEFTQATEAVDYEGIPYEVYWDYYLDLYSQNGGEITELIHQQIHTVRVYARNYCPMGCRFCSSTHFLDDACGRRSALAGISPDRLLRLLQRIVKAHPRVKTVYFTDDDFCSKREDLLEFLGLLISARLPLTFISFARIDDLDDEVISQMVKAGFRTLNIGIESFRPEILKEYNKKLDLERINRTLEMIRRHGLAPAATFILCSPESKLEWIEQTARRILDEADRHTLQPGVNVTVQPQKGSRFHEEYADIEIQLIPIPGTRHFFKREHFIQCTDLEVREFQFRFLKHWANYMERINSAEGSGHLNSQSQSLLKLKQVLEVIEEIKAERGRLDQLRHIHMSAAEKNELWKILQKYSYGASL